MKNRIINHLTAASLIASPIFLNSCVTTSDVVGYFRVTELSVLPSEIHRHASPRKVRSLMGEPAWTEVVGHGLRLMSVGRTAELLDHGRSLVIVALVNTELHIRIFDANGEKVVDKPENKLIGGRELTDLKKLLNSTPITVVSNLSMEEEQKIINRATSSAGHARINANFRTHVWHYEDRWHTEQGFGSWNIYFQETPPSEPAGSPHVRYVGWRLTEPRSSESGDREAFFHVQ